MIEDHLAEYVDVVEAARVLGIYPESVKRLIRYGKLAAEKVGNKWFIRRDVLQTYASTRDPRTGRVKTLFDQQ